MPLSYAEVSCDVFPVCKIYYIPFAVMKNVIMTEEKKFPSLFLRTEKYLSVLLFLFGDLNGSLVCKLLYLDAVICSEIVLNAVNGVISELHCESYLKA